jgi:hypothetical protein
LRSVVEEVLEGVLFEVEEVGGLFGTQTGDSEWKVKGHGRMDFRHPPGDNPHQNRIVHGDEDAMRVKHHAQGKFYVIECPEGTRLVRRTSGGEAVKCDQLIVPLNGKELRIPADPPELLPMLAESGNFGIKLVGEPVPDVNLAGVICPECGEDDVNWLQLRDDSETVHCDYCVTDFDLPVPTPSHPPVASKEGD